MASKRITELSPLVSTALRATDPFPVVSLGASETRKIDASELAKGLITLLPDGEIPGAKIDGELAKGSIGTDELADNSVNSAKLADNSSTFLYTGAGNRPTDGAFVGQLATNSEADDQVIYVWNGTSWIIAIQPGDLTDGSVTASKLDDNSTALFVATGLPATGDFIGQLLFETSTGLLYIWNGADWASPKAAGSINDLAFGAGPVTISITEVDDTGSIQLDTSYLPSTGARQFVAGPTGAGGDVGLRVIVGSDLPTASSSEQGAVVVNGSGLAMDGSQIVIDNEVTPPGGFCIAEFNEQGLAVDIKNIEGSDLPPGSESTPGALQPSPDDFSVSETGYLELITQSPSGGTYAKVTVNEHGIVTSGGGLTPDDIPNISADKITLGEFPTARLEDNSVTRFKLADYSTSFIQEAAPRLNDTGHIGMLWFQQSTGQLRIFDGNSWFFVGYSVVEQQNIRFGGLIDASTGLVTSLTDRGVTAGLEIGEIVPDAASNTNGLYLVAEVAGDNVGVTPGQTYTVGDWCLCIEESGAGPSWRRIDVTDGGVGSGGGGTGSSTLEELTDTTIDNPQDGDVLIFSSRTGKWENAAIIDGGTF